MSAPADIHEEVMEVGKKALVLIQRFLSGRVHKEEFLAGMNELPAREILARHWEKLTSDPKYVPHWQVLQTLQGLVDELEYQLGEYGESTLHEDMNEIAVNLKRISDQEASAAT